MRKIFILILLMAISGLGQIAAQTDERPTVKVTGVVMDENNESMIGVSVAVKDMPGFGTITDVNGRYEIKLPQYSYLVFTYLGYEKREVFIKEAGTYNVTLKEAEATVLDEVTVTATGAQKKISITGAVTTVEVDQLKTPTASITNSLAGTVPGIIARQTSGQPGDNISEFWIRGISTFGAGSEALVLVDGFERSMNDLNIEDIESFTVLKDASATAIYGSRGANGVILITTKRGKESKTRVNAKVETSYNTRTITPEFVDGYTYARMMNEALTTRNQPAAYNDDELHLIRTGLDPDIYPNIDWMDVLLKKGAPTYRATVDLNGGGTMARYFISASYVNEGGMYNTDKSMKDYNTNANYHRWNYRMNVDIDLTKTTLIKVGVSGSLDKKNSPGSSYNDLWAAAMGYNPILTPISYSTGEWASFGDKNYTNPWVLSTQMGYSQDWNNKVQTTANLEQDLSFITKGLKFIGRYGYDINTKNWAQYFKRPELWKAERQRDANGNLILTRVVPEQLMTYGSSSEGERKEYLEAELHYDRNFNGHIVGGVLKYSQDKTVNNSQTDLINAIDRRHQGLAGRFTYGWKNRYFFDFNFGYNGSENFAAGHRFGFFPAYSAAWNVAEEPFAQKYLKWMNMFKIRYSYGKVGNDALYIGDTQYRFPYHPEFITTIDADGTDNDNLDGRYIFGDIGNQYLYEGLTYQQVASVNITWEIATKHDLGLDFSLFGDRFSGTVDYFHEKRTGIFMERQYLAPSIGMNHGNPPRSNVGAVLSKGFDGNVAFHQKFGEVDFTLRGNFTYSKNEILEYDEQYSNYPYTRNAGYRVNQLRGLIAEGLFTSYEDIRYHADQSGLMGDGQGQIAPGDIKYKDINGDGVINDNDIVPIGSTTRPNFVYGFGVSALWKGFDINVHFQGVGKSSFIIDGSSVYAFKEGNWGNILTDMVGNYWQLDANENPNAKYPRLSYGGNDNNYRASTYWMRDGSYLRLKNLEIGYTLPKSLTRAIHLEGVRIYFLGTNLLTFSKFKLWDPELGSSNGQEYPLSRTYTLGLTINI